MAIQAHLYSYPGGTNTGFPLCGSQDLMTTDFNSHQQRTQNTSLTVNPALLLPSPNANAYNNTNTAYLSISNPQGLPVHFDNQRGQVDHYIKSQSERLRTMLQEQRKQQVAALLNKAESDAVRMLSQKDQQIAQAAKKRAELEEFLTRLEADNLSWRRVAQENEATVLSLHNTLEQVKVKEKEKRSSHRHNNKNKNGVETEDAESFCDEIRRRNKATEEEGTGENRVPCGLEQMICRKCNSRRSCIMLLPCRHLCSCKACEAFLQACPVCHMPKKSSIETLLL